MGDATGLTTRPRSVSCQVSVRIRAVWTEAAVEKCRKRRAESTRSESGKRRRASGATSQRFLARPQSPGVRPGSKRPFGLLLGTKNLSPFLPSSDKERRTALLGEGGGSSHDRWVVVKTLIATFWEGSGFFSYLPISSLVKFPSYCTSATSAQV